MCVCMCVVCVHVCVHVCDVCVYVCDMCANDVCTCSMHVQQAAYMCSRDTNWYTEMQYTQWIALARPSIKLFIK